MKTFGFVKICKDLFEAYLQQIVVDGFMHADPHPGNVYLTEDNKVALLDLGMVAHISNELRQNYLKLILHIRITLTRDKEKDTGENKRPRKALTPGPVPS